MPGTTGRWEGLFQVPCYLIQRGTNGYFARVHTWTILPSITTWEWSLENACHAQRIYRFISLSFAYLWVPLQVLFRKSILLIQADLRFHKGREEAKRQNAADREFNTFV
ncbi:hypothetical protein B0F90DRAFT_1769270 [Multifurca ochricompacta]|uniref:Uncharacterized protein n=1 Tax=Multifurca ochricompacta TaxID=376703 RepID=A0AAD4QIJ2_9AGAM|nr:hypothetical protein B0F90DRAFT_1769270 [Multifurca ochricompacta]